LQYSVFDVAHHFLSRADREELSPLKLQKLCFYGFGWYSYQTGSALFRDQFYAMEMGPVVSDLLSAHAGRRSLSLRDLQPQFEERDSLPKDFDSYTQAVLGAVWDHYGRFSASDLVDMTHEEQVWIDAWKSRPTGSKRGDMHKQDVVEHFFFRRATVPKALKLPDARVSVEDPGFITSIDAIGTATPESYFTDLQRFLTGAA
jgi:uncharacterized phage-associated protein